MAAENMNANGTPADARSRVRPLAIAYLAVFALLVLAGIAIAIFGNSRSGEPVVRLQISEGLPGTKPAKLHIKAQAAAATTPQIPATIVQPIYAGTALVADPALIETTDNGPLPRIGADGRTPLQAYAVPVSDATKPRIAIVISGLGISAKATAAALAKLPPQVTLAFAPYAADVQTWVTQARHQGHEVLLEVPMEPFDFPDSDPGPHTLRSGVAEDANTERLVWALTRFTGYTGVTNLLGGRLLSDSDSLEPVLTYLARRGLLFFDNGAATHSAAPDVASRAGVAFAQATLTIDSIQTAMEIDHELSELETQARANGSASGSGFIYPVTIDRVAQWAQGLSGRGFVLVPASAIVTPKK
ncbi:MAG: divergent polysaccharide deacetylase family protein [Rhizomicrobium sp.]